MAIAQNTRTVKMVSIRITAEQAKRLQEVAPCMPGKTSINSLAQRGVDLFLQQVAPIWESAYKEAQS